MSGEPARFLVELLLMIKKIKLHVNWFLLSRNKMEFDAVISNETMVPPCEPYYPNAKKVTDVAEVFGVVCVHAIINQDIRPHAVPNKMPSGTPTKRFNITIQNDTLG